MDGGLHACTHARLYVCVPLHAMLVSRAYITYDEAMAIFLRWLAAIAVLQCVA